MVYAPANAKNQIDLLNHVISNDKKSFLESDKSPIMALKILLLLLDAVKLVLPWSCLLIEFNLLMILSARSMRALIHLAFLFFIIFIYGFANLVILRP